MSYDYVIVGAGSAGCILANKLSANPGYRVLLLEAGPKDRAKEIRIPAAFSKLFKSKYDWSYETTPQRGLNGRRIYFPRGKTLGGSSAMNAQMHIPGHPADFDDWPEGWGWDAMKPYLESFEEESCSVSQLRDPNPMTRAFVEAARSVVTGGGDLTPERLEGAAVTRVHQRKGLRCTAADAWLKPAKGRDNLDIETGAHVLGVEFEGTRAAGVRYRQDGEDKAVSASREVILSGGAINSPQLLMLSGVGPVDELRQLGIEVVHDLNGVGRNLRDHVMALTLFDTSGKDSLFAAEKPIQLARLLLRRRGMLTSNVGEAAAFTRSRDDVDAPDLELLFGPVLYLEEGLTPPASHGFSIAAVCLRPRSVGNLTLASKDPLDPPEIDPGFLEDPADVRVLVEGVKRARAVAQAGPLADWAESERAPGAEATSDDDIEAWLRANAHTIYHPVGTCRLGDVVDSELRVRGVEGLRVVDASVIPNLMRGHSHAQVSMVAMRAAETIRRAPLPARSSA